MSVETSVGPTAASVHQERSRRDREHVTPPYAEQLRAFQAHAGVFIVAITVMIGVNLVTNLAAGLAGSWSTWWSLWALVGWIPGVAIHGLVVWLHRPSRPAGPVVGGAS